MLTLTKKAQKLCNLSIVMFQFLRSLMERIFVPILRQSVKDKNSLNLLPRKKSWKIDSLPGCQQEVILQHLPVTLEKGQVLTE
jgi:hypothetical protein